MCLVAISLLLINLTSYTCATPVSLINTVFEVFNPFAMVRFFEFSDQGWNITADCLRDMYIYLEGLQEDQKWAIKLFDSSGYYSGGLYAERIYRIDGAELCRELNIEKNIYFSKEQYKFINEKLLPFPVNVVIAKYRMTTHLPTTNQHDIIQAICTPKSCKRMDLKQILSYNHVLNGRFNKIVQNVNLIDLRVLQEAYIFTEDFNFYVLIFMLSTVFCMILIAEIYEKLIKSKNKEKHNKIVTLLSNPVIKINDNIIRSKDQSLIAKTAIEQLTKLNNLENHSLTNLKMHPLAESMTVNNINTNSHVNLVKVKKIKTENIATISLDIFAGNCDGNGGKGVNNRLQSYSGGTLKKLINAFSWRRNLETLFNKHPSCESLYEEYSPVHGLRAICVHWIMFIHTSTTLSYVADSNYIQRKFVTVLPFLAHTATFSMDTFFFLAGIQIGNIFYNTVRSVSDKMCGFFEQFLHFSAMIVYKALCLVLPYITVLIVLQLTMRHFHDHNIMEIPSRDHLTCKENMWRNILYIDTLFPLTERCMLWSWYISLEAQLYIVASILLLISRNHMRYAVIIASAFYLSSLAATVMLRLDEKMIKKFNFNFDEKLANINGIYGEQWIRIGPYLIGMCLSFILHKCDGNLKIHKALTTLGWLTSSILVVGIAIAPIYVTNDTNRWLRAGFSTVTHTLWSTVLMWLILACVSGNGGFIGKIFMWRHFYSVSRNAYCILLVHPLLLRCLLLSADHTVHVTFGTLMTIYLGVSVLAHGFGFFLFMLYDGPVRTLLSTIHHRAYK